MHRFLCFRDGKLVTVIESIQESLIEAKDFDYYISDPKNFDEQIKKWRQKDE